MARAGIGQILSTLSVLDASRTRFHIEPIDPFRVKGKTEPVATAVVGPAGGVAATVDDVDLPLIGRRAELKILLDGAESAVSGAGVAFQIVGAPGIGKSRLLDEVVTVADRLRWMFVVCERYHRNTPYYAAAQLLRRLIGIEEDAPPGTIKRMLTDTTRRVAPELLPWLPLIGSVVGVSVRATKQTRALDSQFVKDRTEDALRDLIVIMDPRGDACDGGMAGALQSLRRTDRGLVSRRLPGQALDPQHLLHAALERGARPRRDAV